MTAPAEVLLRCLQSPSRLAADELAAISAGLWQMVLDRAVEYEVEGLLYRRLSSTSLAPAVPDSVLQRLKDLYSCSAMWNRKVLDDARVVLAALRQNGIEVAVLKGAHLAEAVYRDVALRPMTDIDLLVRPSELARAEQLLIELGFGSGQRPNVDATQALHHHLEPFRRTAATTVEVHWNIVQPNSPFSIDIEGLWNRARPCVVAGVHVLGLGPADLLLHLCTHASYHHRFGIDHPHGIALKHLHDIAFVATELGDEIDWPQLVAIANTDGRARYIYATFALVSAMFGTRFPPETLALKHGPAEDEVATDVRACAINSKGERLSVRYRQMGQTTGWFAKTLALFRIVFPAPTALRLIYDVPAESPLLYGYYFVRPVDLLFRRGSVVLAMARLTSGPRLEIEDAERCSRVETWLDGKGPLPELLVRCSPPPHCDGATTSSSVRTTW
jgi:hypothetical protein